MPVSVDRRDCRIERGYKHEIHEKCNDKSSIRKVWSDDRKACFCVIGTVGDLLSKGIFEYADCSPEMWAFIPASGVMIQKTWFGETRKAVMKYLERTAMARQTKTPPTDRTMQTERIG